MFLASRADIVIYGGSAGGGKGLLRDEVVVTPYGYRQIGSLQVGDRVLARDGTMTQVIGVYPQPEQPVYRVEFADGGSLVCDGPHLWNYCVARQGWRKSGRQWKVATTDQLRSMLESGRELLIPLCEPLKFNKTYKCDQRPVDPYLLGLLLGDGCLRQKQVSLTTTDAEILDSLPERESWVRANEISYLARGALRKRLIEQLTYIGVYGKLAHEKAVPEAYCWGSVQERTALLQGLMDADGTCSPDGKAYFTSVSQRLAEQVRWLVLSLGGRATITSKFPSYMGAHGDRIAGREAYTCYIRMPDNRVLFRLSRKRDLAGLYNGGGRTLKRKIRSITPAGRAATVCIRVDHPESLYVAGRDLVVTHNTYSLLLEALRHTGNKQFGAVIFRRTMPQIDNEGGLWDESAKLYSALATPVKSPKPEWRFPSGATVSFHHLEHDKNVLDWQGSQIPLLMFDELTHFSEYQFWYMLSRNRSMCGVKPYVRATCNPDPDSFVARLIDWWIDPDTGYAIQSRSGVMRYFVRVAGELRWSEDPADLERRYPDSCWQDVDGVPTRIGPKSLTFIHSSITDNKALLKADPGYMANLNALPRVDRERLKLGNWKIRDERTVIYKPSWWRIWPDDKPFPDVKHVFASWDTAFTPQDQRLGGQKPAEAHKIAYSACTVWGVWLDEMDCGPGYEEGRYKLLLLAAWWGRVDWPDLRDKVAEIGKKRLTHETDAHLIEDAASGKSLIQDLRRAAGKVRNRVLSVKPTPGDGRHDAKTLRAYLGQPLLKDGFVWAPNRPWARETISWLAAFPGGDPPSADLADTMSMALQHLSRGWWIHHPDDEIEEPPPTVDYDDDPEDELRRGRVRRGGFYG
jgi:phage terminase large subunit-like protein